MVVVTVPKTPTSAYNTDRPVSDLLISQIERLQRVVRDGIKTEGQAAEYIRALTRRVKAQHPQIAPTSYAHMLRSQAKRHPKRSPKPATKRAHKRKTTTRAKSGRRRSR